MKHLFSGLRIVMKVVRWRLKGFLDFSIIKLISVSFVAWVPSDF